MLANWKIPFTATLVFLAFLSSLAVANDIVAVKGKKIHTVSGTVIENGLVICSDGKIAAIGDAASVAVPEGARVFEAEVVLPGLIDVRTCVGLSGLLNASQDSDQLEASSPLQPELRAIDAYNGRDELVEYLRSYGVTTVHTGHAPGELISGQTLIAKTHGSTIEESILVDGRAVCCTLAETAKKAGKQSPGTRGKQVAMLRQLLIDAGEYRAKQSKKSEGGESKPEPPRNLKLEAMAAVLDGKKALLITADRAQDIANALRLADEFRISIWLDSAAEAHELIPEIQKAQIPILLHPTMARASGERENLTLRSAAILKDNKIPFAIQGGYESYVPKARVILFEAAIAAAHGLSRDAAIEAITLSPARILGIADRVGSLEVGKHADLALYDGDPLEYTTHCVGVLIAGKSYPGE
jgi:imidazolonepropionase-like amidohydrolase